MTASRLKLTIATLAIIAAPLLAYADQLSFRYHRFGNIVIDTAPGKGHVLIEYSDKDPKNDEIIFQSRLIRVSDMIYRTPHGTLFTLEHLSHPIINDGNRRINSGDWKLTVSGSGAEFVHLKPRMPEVAFGDTPPFVYLGEKLE